MGSTTSTSSGPATVDTTSSATVDTTEAAAAPPPPKALRAKHLILLTRITTLVGKNIQVTLSPRTTKPHRHNSTRSTSLAGAASITKGSEGLAILILTLTHHQGI